MSDQQMYAPEREQRLRRELLEISRGAPAGGPLPEPQRTRYAEKLEEFRAERAKPGALSQSEYERWAIAG